LFGTNQNQRTAGPNYFKALKELAVFMEELIKNQEYYEITFDKFSSF
jgi:hypothetical protein